MVHADGALNWFYPFDGWINQESPAIGPDGTIYVTTAHAGGTLFAFAPDPSQPVVRWSHLLTSDAAATGAPDGTIYVGTTSGQVIAFNPDGTRQWVFTTDGYGRWSAYGIIGPPMLGSDGTIYVTAATGPSYLELRSQVYALNPDGTRQWVYPRSGFLDTVFTTALVVDAKNRLCP